MALQKPYENLEAKNGLGVNAEELFK